MEYFIVEAQTNAELNSQKAKKICTKKLTWCKKNNNDRVHGKRMFAHS